MVQQEENPNGVAMTKDQMKSWEVSDEFWERVAPLIPPPKRNPNKEYKRKPGGGRKAIPDRTVFEAIIYVLKTGCQWQALPKKRFGSPSAIYMHFARWQKEGFFLALWQAGLAEYDEMEGIAWKWKSIDGVITKTPVGEVTEGEAAPETVNKMDEKRGVDRRVWCPALDSRNRSQTA